MYNKHIVYAYTLGRNQVWHSFPPKDLYCLANRCKHGFEGLFRIYYQQLHLPWLGAMPAHDVTYTVSIEDAIEQMTIDKSHVTIYDLTGRKVTDTENLKGSINIVNGKKVVI